MIMMVRNIFDWGQLLHIANYVYVSMYLSLSSSAFIHVFELICDL